ncbi:uncharacterized protein EDB91DRAFT_1079008 [Suillus paluster]|uniref:uncharacterized protein n=1 Tax=Suillus paluster TaxID=48578 RepID=UPI001B86C26C|nr:uncharacterized protein EDB91DRAFT_1079008 [Suillus paluster]KAG1748874.1 hypothetical protein EDB91DRAFT_1079008 [Suillus paluster]
MGPPDSIGNFSPWAHMMASHPSLAYRYTQRMHALWAYLIKSTVAPSWAHPIPHIQLADRYTQALCSTWAQLTASETPPPPFAHQYTEPMGPYDVHGHRPTSVEIRSHLISNWANNVPAEPKSTIPSSRSNTYSASHVATTPPSLVLSTSTKTSSKAKPAYINQKLSISAPESNDVLMVSDNSLDDPEALEQRPAVLPRKKGKQFKDSVEFQKSTIIVPASESDSEPEQITFSAEPGSIKQKADDVGDFVDETTSEATDDSGFSADGSQEFDGLLPKTSTIVSQSATPPPCKKLKKESSEVTNYSDLVPLPSTQVPVGYYNDVVPPPSTQVPPASQKAAANEVVKPHSQCRNNDLPVPADSKAFLSMALLWAGSQANPWEISKSLMADALQEIFDVVYPDVKYKVNSNGTVFAVTQQWLSEWRSNISSTALVIVVDFCSCIKDAPNALVAKQLLKDSYLSMFVLQMIASTHLSAIVDHASVPALYTDKLTLGNGMDGVIVLCVIALEHTLKFVKDSIINVDEVLASMATGKFSVKLPAKHNKVMGKMSSRCYNFSFTYWHDEMEAYMKSISNRNEDSKLIIISHARRYMTKSARGDASDEDIKETQSIDERALICKNTTLWAST